MPDSPGSSEADSTHHVIDEVLPDAVSLGLTGLVHEREVGSTMDVAHTLASEGAPAGLLVVADRQRRGRGRTGNQWASADGAGLWMTLIERPADARAVSVMALRLGLALAQALAPLTAQQIRLKWPNDVFAGTGKLAGILVEARWRGDAVDWVAIGIGINRQVPHDLPQASSVHESVSRATVLKAVLPGLRDAAARSGLLTAEEMAAWRAIDLAFGRPIVQPRVGIADGIDAGGALRVIETGSGAVQFSHAGSLVFAD